MKAAAARKVAREVQEREEAREKEVRHEIAAQKKADAAERERERVREEETRENIKGALGDLLIEGGALHKGRGRGQMTGVGGEE